MVNSTDSSMFATGELLHMAISDSGKPIEILLVEDNPDDVDLTIEALKDGKVRNHVSVVEDGVEALQFLRQEGNKTSAPRPDLILLDLNMPRMGGLEVLDIIKKDPDLKRIPVVIMTSSEEEAEYIEGYNRHANCCVNKPLEADEFISKVRAIEDFWLSIVRLPAA
jgi:CheY-like chemotaxis protein